VISVWPCVSREPPSRDDALAEHPSRHPSRSDVVLGSRSRTRPLRHVAGDGAAGQIRVSRDAVLRRGRRTYPHIARVCDSGDLRCLERVVLVSLSGLSLIPPRRGSRGLSVSLVLLLGVFVCESAIHSAHHLRDPQQAARCPLLSASQHLTGTTASVTTPDVPPPVSACGAPLAPAVHLHSSVHAGEQPRAPPPLRLAHGQLFV
jgi:hypothetical protein